jgi:hypothetical protein
MERKLKEVSVLLILVFLAGCGYFQGVGSTFEKMTPKQRSAYFMDFYNTQYADYLYVASKEGLKEDEKVVLRKRKEILTQLYAAIRIYDAVVVLGKVPTQMQEADVLKFINDLLRG